MARLSARNASAGPPGGAAAPVALLLLLLPAACRSPVPAPIVERSPNASQEPGASDTAISRPSYYVVRQGDTVYAIAWRFGLDHRSLAAWNGIGPSYLIQPGRRLQLFAPPAMPAPAAIGATTRPAAPPPKPLPPEPASVAPSRPVESRPQRPPESRSAPPAVEPGRSLPAARPGPIRWQWPAAGEIISGFVPGRQRGLDIGGEMGQPITAAADGEVVYSGVGLVGYGELIIIKHDEQFLSAYAHNRRRLVGEGERVSRGARIAEMGDSGTDRPKLHFEIRKEGQPVNPLNYLPAGTN